MASEKDKQEFYNTVEKLDLKKPSKGKGEKEEDDDESLIHKRSTTKQKLLRFFLLRPSSNELKNRNILKTNDVPRTPQGDKKGLPTLEKGLTQRATLSDLMRRNVVSSKGPASAGDVSPRFLAQSENISREKKSRSLTMTERENAKSLLHGFFNKAPSEKNLASLHHGEGLHISLDKKKGKKSKGVFRPISSIFNSNKIEKPQPITTSRLTTTRGAAPLPSSESKIPPPIVLSDEDIQAMMQERIAAVKYVQFGVVPERLQELYPDQPRGLPMIITCSFAHVEKFLTKEGIFRIPPTLTKLMDVKNAFEEGWTDLSAVTDASVVAGLISMFIREVPEPLFTFDLYDSFMQAQDVANPEERIAALKGVLEKLPRSNYRVIRQILILFHRVGAQSAVNKMNAKNLSLIFGNTLLKPRIEPPDLPLKILKQAGVVEFMINNCAAVFEASAEDFQPVNLDGIEVKSKPPVEETPPPATAEGAAETSTPADSN